MEKEKYIKSDWLEGAYLMGMVVNYEQNSARTYNVIDTSTEDATNCVMNGKSQLLEDRIPLWHIDEFYLCSTIGTCLALSEQKKILAKEKFNPKRLSLYEIHCIMIKSAKTENSISRRINRLLNQKYHEDILVFSHCNEQKFLSIWREKLAVGNICGMYWFAVTNKRFSDKMLGEIFGDVHMLSHINGREVRNSLQGVLRANNENARLNTTLKEEKKARKKMMENLYILEKNLTVMERKYHDVTLHNKELIKKMTEDISREQVAKLEEKNSELQNLLTQAEDKLRICELSIASLKDEKKIMRSELSTFRESNSILTRELYDAVQQFSAIYKQCDKNCPAFDLCEKRILIVGGITKMKNFYRNIIEQKGGMFDYHDGYMQGGEDSLEVKVKRSDVVLCPIDVNSHNACLSVKKICKKIDKPYRMLLNSSLSSIKQSLMQISIQPGRQKTIEGRP